MQNKDDLYFMKKAITAAKRASRVGEVPVGAVIVKGTEIISGGRNMRELDKNSLLHAEIVAINRACKKLGRWRLSDCDLYVTLEPCPMCTGAAINTRFRRVIFGAYDNKAGSLGSVINLNELGYNHKLEVVGGVMKDECAALLSDFFKQLRNRIIKHKEVQYENPMG
ncbi:MAG: tRNA-specific adenosine deaminase [Clostridiales bacterium GWF2_38_85]|nr:MAG: tRNA-specific adenosine deaminase [Clostridiales bacterium GWF2_38_85]HBL84955.1 tRNA-specific adenosine deaminase [Clostridiales bacterium]